MNSTTDLSASDAAQLRVCMVTPFPPRADGIATYSSELINAMESFGHTVYVISHTDENVGGHEAQPNVFGIIDISKPDWERVIFRQIMDLKPDVVHIQHEYGLYANAGDYGISIIDLLFLPFRLTSSDCDHVSLGPQHAKSRRGNLY